MEEVEAGRVEAIVIKDMSRLGRDYLKVGQVMEILRQRGVRLIAINDGVDSLKGDDDFMLGMKVKDIAAMEGITPSQAGKSIHAALRRLRRYFIRRKWTSGL